MRIFKKLQSIGPAALVPAAFIGPGTVTTCSVAGASFGYSLLWALLFSIFATIVLQEMSARLGIIGRKGLGEALRETSGKGIKKIITIILVISAIAIGNAAYETGNILGAVLGLETISGLESFSFFGLQVRFWSIIIGLFAFIILILGSYKSFEKILIGLVILMSITFIGTAILIFPNIAEVVKGAFVPTVPKGSMMTIVGLIGTTVVPYNLFLHASAVKEKWNDPEKLKEARMDIYVSIGLGGLISMAIIITSATAFFGTDIIIKSAADMAVQLEPFLGSWSKVILSIGLFSAGVSSSVTAPLAAAYASSGILGWDKVKDVGKFKVVWIIVLFIGVIFASLGFKPVQAILFAQVTNGVLLSIVACYLLWVMNRKQILGDKVNSLKLNVVGGLIVLIAFGLGLRSILHVFGVF